MNAVTYARYSTGRQRKASLEERSRVPQMYPQLAFELERALKADVTTAREILRPLVEGATLTEENGQKWIENETGRAAIAVGLSLGLVAGARSGRYLPLRALRFPGLR